MSERTSISYGSLIRDNVNFRYLWSGQIVSLLGDWFNLIASATLVAELTQSGIAVGGLFVVRMLAQLLVSPFAGVAADRFNRKRLLILTDIGRAITVLGFLFVQEPEQVWLLYVLTVIQMAMSGFFFPARNAILPDIVSRRELGSANALSSATWSVMLAFGAALGGIVAGGWGVRPAFIIDALTFFVSAIIISRIAYTHEPALAGTDKSVRAGVKQYLDGLQYLWRRKDFLVIASHKAAFALVAAGAFQVVQVALTQEVYVIGDGGGTSLGLMYAFMGIGTGIGPIIARRFTGDREGPLRRAITISYVIATVGMVLIAPLLGFGLVLIGVVLRGVGGGIGWVFSTQLLLQKLPDRVRGRVFSTEFAMFTLASAISAAGGGWMLDNTDLGISGMLWLMAFLTLIPGVLWFFWNTTRRRTDPPGESKEESQPDVPVSG